MIDGQDFTGRVLAMQRAPIGEPERRIRGYALSLKMMANIWMGKARIVNWPEDATVVGVHYDAALPRCLMVMVASKEFDPVGDFEVIVYHAAEAQLVEGEK